MMKISTLYCVVALLLCSSWVTSGFEQPCTYTSSSGDYYDLSPLSDCSGKGFSVDGDGGSFDINICNTVTGCGGDSASCQDGSYNTGEPDHASFSDYSGGKGVVLTYGNGDNNGCSGARSTVITFICQENATTPQISFTSENPQCTYNMQIVSAYACPTSSAPQINQCPINVFLVPHTHDDVGWLETIEGYYSSEVKNILDTVLEALVANPDRKFIYVEQAYFWRWWKDGNTTDQQRTQFKQIYANGQFEFVIGGWVMQDEACTTYGADINQMTLGHQFLLNEFGARPSKGWQLDPFGASSVTPTLNKLSGFDAHLIDRVSNKATFASEQMLQFEWRGSPSLGDKAAIFTEIMDGGTNAYCDWFFAFDFENNPVNSGNVAQYANTFIQMVQQRTPNFKTPNILAAWGCDFQFQNAVPMFESMDLVVQYLQQNYNTTHINVKYALLDEYFDAVKNYAATANTDFPVNYGDDFFPLDEDLFWTGYFTSRVELKGEVRVGEATALLAENLYSVAKLFNKQWDTVSAFESLTELRLANADAQHHDGVTGTSVPEVVDMYYNDLKSGGSSSLQVVGEITAAYVSGASSTVPSFNSDLSDLLNLGSQPVPIVIHNALSWTRTEYVALPVNIESISVFDESNTLIPSQVNPAYLTNSTGKYTLFFQVNIPAFGFATYFAVQNSSVVNNVKTYAVKEGQDEVIENTYISLTISGTTGRISNFSNLQSSISIALDQELQQYVSLHSGAYAFGPAGPSSSLSSTPFPKSVVSSGPLVTEVYQIFPCDEASDSYAKQNIRVYSSSTDANVLSFAELSFELGQLPSAREIITSFKTSVNSQQVFSTDDNGFEFNEREYSYGTAIEANYYPLIYAGFIQDDNTQFTVITERSHGASSLENGQFEVMLHRNPDMGDGFGPGLTDTTIVYPAVRLLLDTPTNSKLLARQQPYLMNFPLVPFTTTATGSVADWVSDYQVSAKFLTVALPDNVHMHSLYSLNSTQSDNTAVLRLTHLFAVGEHPVYSQPATVDLSSIFSTVKISSISETTLTANRVIADVTDFTITLQPKDIRTFLVNLVAV